MNTPGSSRRLAYLYSRYPVISQTFCDSEMLALEASGFDLDIASINPPPSTIRHERFEQLTADVFYPAPAKVLQALQKERQRDGSWDERFGAMIARHDAEYGESFKAATRARNALYFAELFARRGVQHVHVHFANRATHTALFIKQWAGIPFSFTPHAQDFMIDLGSDDLLRELCREAEFVVAVSDHSRDILRDTCPESADKIERIYNGITMVDFPQAAISQDGPLKIITIGRLIEFKGFHYLIEACAKLSERGVDYECCIIGEGPWRQQLLDLAEELGVSDKIEFAGVQTQEEVKRRLQASDVFALPCIVDSKGASDILPTVITESMACSLPIVSTRLVGVPEMVDDGETGILVKSGDADAFAGALRRLAEDRALARKMGRSGREKALQVFELQITSGQLAEKFDRALAEGVGVKKGGEQAPILYLLESLTPQDECLDFEIASVSACQQKDIQFMVAQVSPSASLADRGDQLSEVDFFPDGMVLEAEWEFSHEDKAKLMQWRKELGNAVATEDYLIQARRALHLNRLVRKRGVRHLHAMRSGMLLCAWMVQRLSGVTFSMAVEARPDIGRSALDKIASEAVLVSRADYEGAEDLLHLRPVRAEHLKLGPLKIRQSKTIQYSALPYQDWVEQLLKIIAS
ncbi:MAG: glycosyltransferase family 4 protein [Verrucomicrobiales bacterium]|nr:glycosyltransferase family 4 protein [Verrucomicrobiales bacterium]